MISFSDSLICVKNQAILAKSTLKFLAPAQPRTVQVQIFSSKTSFCLTFRNCRNCVIFCWFPTTDRKIVFLLISRPMSLCENFATGVSKLLSVSSCLGVLSIDSCSSSF